MKIRPVRQISWKSVHCDKFNEIRPVRQI